MYAFAKVTGDTGRAFEMLCKQIGLTPREMIESMIANFVAQKNITPPPPIDHGEGLDKFTSIYQLMKRTREALNREAEEEADKIKEQMEGVKAHLLKCLNEAGVQSMRTNTGTFYKQKVLKPACADWTAFHEWIKVNDAFDFLERRVTKSAVEKYMEEHDALPPGISAHIEYDVIVRKGKDS